MVIEKNTLFYFSGTGNSLMAAKDLSSSIGSLELCMLASLSDEKEIEVKSEILGLVFPVYYARMPLTVESFIRKLKVDRDTYVFAVITHGGGPAEVLTKLKTQLQNNSITLNSGFLLHMPGNHIFAYNPRPVKKDDKVFEREKEKINKIAGIIGERKECKCESSRLVIDTLIDRVTIKITDKIIESFHEQDENFWVNDSCSECRRCEKICPVHNITWHSDKPVWQHHCEHCTACIQYCPKEAIQWGDKTAKRNRYQNPNINVSELIKV